MATALLSISPVLHLQCREVKAYTRGTQDFFCSRFVCSKSFLSRRRDCSHGTSAVVALMAERKAKKRETVIPDPDYRIPVVLLGDCCMNTYTHIWKETWSPMAQCQDWSKWVGPAWASWARANYYAGLAGGLAYQNNLLPAAPIGLLGLLLLFQTTRVRFVFDEEALEVKVGDQLQESGENVFVGGKNRWKYSTFVNWELWWPNFPVLVYFKEKQTKPEGQVHFFPVIFNGTQLYDVLVERGGPSKTSGP